MCVYISLSPCYRLQSLYHFIYVTITLRTLLCSKEMGKLKHKEKKGKGIMWQATFPVHSLLMAWQVPVWRRGRDSQGHYFTSFPRCTRRMGQSMGRTEYVAPSQSSSHPDWVILVRWSLIWTNFPTPEIGRDRNLNPRLQFIFGHSYAWNREGIIEAESLCAYPGFYTLCLSIRKIEDFLFRKGQSNRWGKG